MAAIVISTDHDAAGKETSRATPVRAYGLTNAQGYMLRQAGFMLAHGDYRVAQLTDRTVHLDKRDGSGSTRFTITDGN